MNKLFDMVNKPAQENLETDPIKKKTIQIFSGYVTDSAVDPFMVFLLFCDFLVTFYL